MFRRTYTSTWEGEAPAEPIAQQTSAQQELRPPAQPVLLLTLFATLYLFIVGCASDPRDRLIAALESSEVEARRAAARALGEEGQADERVVGALTKSVDDADAEVRRRSIDALGQFGVSAKASVPALIRALRDSEPAVALRAALALQKVDPGNSESQPVLIAAMRRGDGRILLEVGAMGDKAAWAVPTLTRLLSHEAPQVRAVAARSLGQTGPPARRAEAALRRATSDTNLGVQQAARDALARLRQGGS
jgi:HEAT repeat protein